MNKHYLSMFALLLTAALAAAQLGTGGMPGMGQPHPGYPGENPSQQGPLGTGQTTTSAEMRNQAKVDDQTLERQIQQQFATHPELNQVKVSVKDGVAELTGSVARKADRKQAKKLAESVPGIRKVKEQLMVNAAAVTAPRPPSAAPTANASSPSGADSSIGLSGAPNSVGVGAPANAGALGQAQPRQSEGAANTTAATPPPVANEAIGAPSDLKVQNQINNDIRARHPGVAGDVAVNVTDNYVILNGSTPDQSTMQQVVALAKADASGRTVVNKMTVAPAVNMGGASGTATGATAATPGQAQSGAPVSGNAGQSPPPLSENNNTAAETSSLQTEINNALQQDPTLANNNLHANVTDSQIELTGSVRSGREKQAARRIAQSYAGNRRVVDHITVVRRGESGTMPGMKQGPGMSPGMGAGGMGTENNPPQPGPEQTVPHR